MGEGPLVRCPLMVDGKTWEVTCISVGNPHCVTIVPEVDSLKLEQIGPGFEHHENFPERINTEFVQVVDATHLKMRVWERGSGETWACGTGTCATVAALTELGVAFQVDSPTNQQFIYLSEEQADALRTRCTYDEEWRREGRVALRLCTSWATQPQALDELIAALREIIR